MIRFNYFFSPTKVYFGENVTVAALAQQKELLDQSVIIVTTGGSLIRNGYLDKLCNAIKSIARNSVVTVYDQISKNPDISEVEKAVEEGIASKAKVVIGFGGGSAIDAAKATAVGLGLAYSHSKDTVTDIFSSEIEPGDSTLPIIAIPTTAGTGTELSKAAIISDRAKGIKSGIRGKKVIPQIAIVDPTYTWTVPENITMETGFDVLAHAFESYVSVKANPFSEMLSEKAISTVGDCLIRLRKNSDDHDARKGMAFASMIMGLNLKDVGTALPHRLQYPVGAATNTSHGSGLIALYTSWIFHEFDYSEEKVKRAIKLLTGKDVSDGQAARYEVTEFLNKIEAFRTLSDLGIGEQSAEDLAKQVTGNIMNDPLSVEDGIIEKIYSESF